MRGLMSAEYHTLKPQTLERGPIPVHSTLREHFYILTRGTIPLVLQALSYHFFPSKSCVLICDAICTDGVPIARLSVVHLARLPRLPPLFHPLRPPNGQALRSLRWHLWDIGREGVWSRQGPRHGCSPTRRTSHFPSPSIAH
jgi:hypothetical protein